MAIKPEKSGFIASTYITPKHCIVERGNGAMLCILVLCRPQRIFISTQCMHACNVKGKSESNVSLFVCGFPRTYTPRPVCTTYWPQRTYYDSKISLESCVSYACAYFSEAYESFVVRHKNFLGAKSQTTRWKVKAGVTVMESARKSARVWS